MSVHHPTSFLIDGIDHLGKSTLINGIKNRLGFYFSIHLERPQVLDYYQSLSSVEKSKNELLEDYQRHTYHEMMKIITTPTRVIFDRTHLGEAVYSPLYRQYDGDYVFDLERRYNIGHWASNGRPRLILLTEDFSVSTHFKDDGLSFDISKRQMEQDAFIDAFHKSQISDKRIICVTASDGNFKPKEEVLAEVLA